MEGHSTVMCALASVLGCCVMSYAWSNFCNIYNKFAVLFMIFLFFGERTLRALGMSMAERTRDASRIKKAVLRPKPSWPYKWMLVVKRYICMRGPTLFLYSLAWAINSLASRFRLCSAQ